MKSTRMLVRYLAEIGSVGGDILRLYRRLVDWNLKKLFVLAYFAGGALMLSVPFVILLVVVGYAYPDLVARLATAAAGIGVGRPWSEMADAIAEAAVPAAGIALAVLGIVTAFLVSSVYSVTLLARVYLGYARGVVTPVKSLPLFSWPLLRRVLAALTWQGLWLLAGLLAVAAVLAGARWVLGVNSPFFYGIIAVAGVAVLVYAVLRMSFVFGALAEEADGSGWSLAKSNWQLFSGWRGHLALLSAVPYLVFILLLNGGFDQLSWTETIWGSILRFFVLDSVELMVFISVYERVRSGSFLR